LQAPSSLSSSSCSMIEDVLSALHFVAERMDEKQQCWFTEHLQRIQPTSAAMVLALARAAALGLLSAEVAQVGVLNRKLGLGDAAVISMP